MSNFFLICNFDLISILFFILITVESLPTVHNLDSYGIWGSRAVPSINGNGAYLQFKEHLYELSCTSSSCTWSLMEQKLSLINDAVMMSLPSDYNCTN